LASERDNVAGQISGLQSHVDVTKESSGRSKESIAASLGVAIENFELFITHLEQALKAHTLFKKDKEYNGNELFSLIIPPKINTIPKFLYGGGLL